MTQRRWLLAGAVGLVLLLVLPLVWWRFLGPTRVEGLELGAVPTEGPAADDLANLDGSGHDGWNLEPSDEPSIELPPLTISPTTTVTLVTSLGSSGMTAAEARRLGVADLGERGSDRLTDSIVLLVSDAPTREAALVSLPRDLWLSWRGHRINETLVRHGTQALIDDVSRVSGLPVHHLVQVNFTAFAALVDGIGGIALAVDAPHADLHASLYVPAAGCWHFDGAAALAYARSRMTLTSRDGGERWVTAAGASDFGRMRRQQALVAAAWDQVRGPGLVRNLPDLLRLADGLTIDAGLGIDEVRELARAFGDVASGRIEGHVLPTVERRVGRARVLAIDHREALPLYARLRAWPPGGGDDGAPAASPAPSGTDGADGADQGSTAEPEATPSPSPSPRPEPPADARPVPSQGCAREQARELPAPGPALAAIARGETPPAAGDPDEDDAGDDAPPEDPGDAGPSPAPSPSPDGGEADEDPDEPGFPDDLPVPPSDDG